MAIERWKQLGILFALLLTGGVVVSLFAGFQQLIAHPFAMIGAILIATVMVLIFVRVALVPAQRYSGWTRTLFGPNGRWLFLILLLLWGSGMAFLASMGLGPQQAGAPALVGLFSGFFLFMGFIWSVIGE
jgi:hypothetical protein